MKDLRYEQTIWMPTLKDRHPVEMFLLFYEHFTFLSFHQFCDRLAVIGGSLAKILTNVLHDVLRSIPCCWTNAFVLSYWDRYEPIDTLENRIHTLLANPYKTQPGCLSTGFAHLVSIYEQIIRLVIFFQQRN